jgi:UrcA family protein
MKTSMKVAPLFAALTITATGVFLIASPSAAKDHPVVVEAPADKEAAVQRVGYGDLNLASAADKKLLHGRVGRAVRKVCDMANPGAHFTDLWMCHDLSWNDAAPQIRRAIDRASATAFAEASPGVLNSIVVRVR